MTSVTRRSFLRGSAGAAGGAAIVGAPAILAGSAEARPHASTASVVKPPSRGVPRESVMAYVRDAERGEVTLVAGTRETTYRDPDLVRRLLRAAPRRARS
jgi:hypothetical protein